MSAAGDDSRRLSLPYADIDKSALAAAIIARLTPYGPFNELPRLCWRCSVTAAVAAATSRDAMLLLVFVVVVSVVVLVVVSVVVSVVMLVVSVVLVMLSSSSSL